MARKSTKKSGRRKAAKKKTAVKAPGLSRAFGLHEPPYLFAGADVRIAFDREEEVFVYRREAAGAAVETVLLAGEPRLSVLPVEPVNEPGKKTHFLLIDFDGEVLVEPRTARTVYLTFPVEVCAFATAKDALEPIDLIALNPAKLTLYGTPANGVLCKHWSSKVHHAPPEPDPSREGVLALEIKNGTSGWARVGQAVFNGLGMKVFWNETSVAMTGEMKVLSAKTAETLIHDRPPAEGFQASHELYTASTLSMTKANFLMMEGL